MHASNRNQTPPRAIRATATAARSIAATGILSLVLLCAASASLPELSATPRHAGAARARLTPVSYHDAKHHPLRPKRFCVAPNFEGFDPRKPVRHDDIIAGCRV